MQYIDPGSSESVSIADELDFLRKHTGKDEPALLADAVRIGLDLLYRRSIEEMFVNDQMPRQEAIQILGEEHVTNLEYAKKALTDDIEQAFRE